MSIDPITLAASIPELRAGASVATGTQPGFADWLTQQLSETNAQIVKADDGVRRLALGEADNLHQVMINLEKAKLSFELVVQVRNKILDAYQDLMRMQI